MNRYLAEGSVEGDAGRVQDTACWGRRGGESGEGRGGVEDVFNEIFEDSHGRKVPAERGEDSLEARPEDDEMTEHRSARGDGVGQKQRDASVTLWPIYLTLRDNECRHHQAE